MPEWLSALYNALPSLPKPRESPMSGDPNSPGFQTYVNDPKNWAYGAAPLPATEEIGELGKGAYTAGKAAKDAMSPHIQGLMDAAKRMVANTSETRWAELAQKFGGLGGR